MGNQLVGIAPSQIYPVEKYLIDRPELKFEAGLGSTRFLKVARAKAQEGQVVVKVFAIHDPSLPLSSYKTHLEEIRNRLASAVNCIPYQKIDLDDTAGFLMREYVKYTLYYKISTRPFLTNIEKKWITFQILYALHQCHKVGVCHGDIKLENITVTSWNWVLLVDFASFKPTFIPEDNPSDYSYFFDTSRRRICYIAPERFTVNSNMAISDSIITEATCDSGNLTPAMDIFSAGCVLLELWNELDVPFEYSQLLLYRQGKYSPQKHLDKLEDENLRNLISSMIDKDPSRRKTAENYLSDERGTLFPEYFYTFLQSYMLIFSSHPILSPDEKMIRLKNDIGNIFKFLGPVTVTSDDDEEDRNEQDKGECEGLVIIISLVTSCVRGLVDRSSKLFSLEILYELACHASDETILDRILPYILYLSACNQPPRVKICAINTITKCLDLVRKVPRSDVNIFPEYILPALAPLATDPNPLVRSALATNIALLASIALRYLEQIQNDFYDSDNAKQNKEGPNFNYELELQALHEMIQQSVSSLLTDTHSIVKQTLLHSGITQLCVFFGKQKASDVLFSHVITFLNDKEDQELRGSFFDCIVGLATYIGFACGNIITPLLLQGLADHSEFVTKKAVNAMTAIVEVGLLNKPSICELVSECSSFLVHPNLWIRNAVAGFISTAAGKLSPLDVQVKLMEHLKLYMSYSTMQIYKTEIFLDTLVPPVPRAVFDSILNYSDIEAVFRVFHHNKMFTEVAKSGKLPTYDYVDMTTGLKQLICRLNAIGLTEEMEKYFLRMENHMTKIHKLKLNAVARQCNQNEGKIELFSSPNNTLSHVFVFESTNTNRALHRTNTAETNINSDWNYSSDVLNKQSDGTNSGGPPSRSTSSRPSSPPPDGHGQFTTSTEPSTNVSLQERSYIQYRRLSCYVELSNLRIRQQDHYQEALRNKEFEQQARFYPPLPPPGWRLRGSLVAHLHEHRKAVYGLCSIPDTYFFGSCSGDGCVKLWDCQRMEGKNIANRSKQHYKIGDTSIFAMTVCEAGQSFGCVAKDGSINVLRIDPSSSKMTVQQSRRLDLDVDGFATDVHSIDSGSQSLLVYSTLYGAVVGWDLRAPGIAWKLENGVQNDITSFCIDSQHNWLTLGTVLGDFITWDLRFRLPINRIEHSPGASVRIRKVICHPTERSSIISSIQGSSEVSIWNLESTFRQKVLWGSSAPPLSKTNPSSHGVCALMSGCIDKAPFLLTGGSDQRVRFFELNNPQDSYLAVPGASDPTGLTLSFDTRLIDGTQVVYEDCNISIKDKDEEGRTYRAGPDPPASGHRDCITDMVLCKATQCFLVSSSRDGVIKVWK